MSPRSDASTGSNQETPLALGYSMPAEWARHDATWLAWPHHRTDWPGKLGAIPWVFAEMAKHLTRGERVRVLVASKAEQARAYRIFERAGVILGQIDFVQAATNRSWTRDYLPLFVVSKARGRSGRERLAAVKWRFDGWGRYRDHLLDDAAGIKVARRFAARVFRPRAEHEDLVLEGGAIDVDGAGTLLTTEECLVSGPRARAGHLGKAGMEKALSDYLGIQQVIWLPNGIAGDDTSGHVDDFARFVGIGRVVVCSETKRSDPNFVPLERAHRCLKRARDARGRQLEVITLPMPAPLFYAGQRLPASYANFYIANQRVLVPTFNDPRDRVALGILEQLFPKREIVGIHAVDLVLGLGTLHCSTMQQPQTG